MSTTRENDRYFEFEEIYKKYSHSTQLISSAHVESTILDINYPDKLLLSPLPHFNVVWSTD